MSVTRSPNLNSWKVALLSVVLLFSGYGTGVHASQLPTVGSTYAGLSSGVLSSAVIENMDMEILVAADDWQITKSEIQKIVTSQEPGLIRQLEKNLFFVLEQEATGRVLAGEAKKAGIAGDSEDQDLLISKLFQQKTAAVVITDTEIREFYQANQDMVGGASFESVEVGMRQYLLQEKQQQVFASYLTTMIGSLQLRINADWLKIQHERVLDNPVDRARRSNTPTMVEFGADGCVPCDMMQPILDTLKEKHKDQLNVVFVHVGEEQVLAARYDIRSIPVQVFFNAQGEEVFRHTGFFAEEEVAKQLAQIGVGE